MGGGASKSETEDEREARRKNMDIEREMGRQKEQESLIIKLLLLGAAESGKSTILKQMRILHTDGFKADEVTMQKHTIRSNTISSMESILDAMRDLGMQLGRLEREDDVRIIREFLLEWDEMENFPPEVTLALLSLWNDDGVQMAYSRSSEYQLHDSAKYFLDAVDRTTKKDYYPTQEDILHSRTKTTGIVELRFQLKRMEFRVFDVGGQRSERKKWIHCFENVNGIIFVTALSEYDQVLGEDDTTNRMQESRVLFESICNSRWFLRTSIILFLNKTDLFAQKIKYHSIKIAFPEFDGAKDFDTCSAYVAQKFEEVKQNQQKKLYKHYTCATNTDQVQLVINSCTDMMVAQNLTEAGIS